VGLFQTRPVLSPCIPIGAEDAVKSP